MSAHDKLLKSKTEKDVDAGKVSKKRQKNYIIKKVTQHDITTRMIAYFSLNV